MNDMTTFTTFEEYKGVLTHELEQASESFVRIGYLLKVARDTAILSGTPYKDVNEFAAAEYNLDKTQVSRFIRINDRFSEGGNSSRLQESFRGIGYAKLSMMLLLPDSLNEEITPAFSKSEVQALKEEVQAEEEVTPIERILEGTNLEDFSMLEKAVYELFRANPEIYVKAWDCCNINPPHIDMPGGREEMTRRLQEILAPAGEQIYSVRIKGVGRIAVSIKGTDRDIMLINLRSDEKEPCGWWYLMQAVLRLTMPAENARAAYESTFGELFPGSTEVAPVQPEKEKRKESKVIKAVPDRKPAPPKKEPEKPESGSGSPEPPKMTESAEKSPIIDEKCTNTKENEHLESKVPAAEEAAEAVNPAVEHMTEGSGEPAEAETETEPAAAAAECEGQTSFKDFPEIMPAPEWKCSEETRERLRLAVHNFTVEVREIVEEENLEEEDLGDTLRRLWMEEWALIQKWQRSEDGEPHESVDG